MAGVLNGFAVIVALVALGWVLARTGVLGNDARLVLNRLVFFVATPALLFDSLARTTLDQVFTGVFVVSAVSAMIIAVLYMAIARLWLRRSASDLVIGALSAGYVNSANLGIPIALYVLGDLGFVMPLLLFQVVVLQPIAIAVLERAQSKNAGTDEARADGGALKGALDAIMQSIHTPIVLAALAGLGVAASPWSLPDTVLEPVHLVGQISVPGALLVFGMSLYGVKVLEAGASPRREIGLASVLKLVAHPLLAYAIGAWVLGMVGHDLLTVVVAVVTEETTEALEAVETVEIDVMATEAHVIQTVVTLETNLL